MFVNDLNGLVRERSAGIVRERFVNDLNRLVRERFVNDQLALFVNGS